MEYAAVFAEIEVPVVRALVESHLVDPVEQHFVALLSLASADDLADSRHQHVHRGDRFAVIVEPHVEGLAVLRIVDDEHRLLEDLFCQVTLVLCLQLEAPLYRIFELLARLLKDVYRLCICDAYEIRVHDVIESLQQALVDEAVEEFHLLRAVLQHVADDVLDHLFGHVHVAVDIAERHLRLHHPELRSVPCGVGVLGSERRPEGVDVAERKRHDLALKLARYSQVGLFAEEVLAVVDVALCVSRQVVEIERGHLEHLAGAFRVAACDLRRVHIDEVLLLEEFVDRVSRDAPYSEYRGECVAARSEVSDLPEELHAVALLLQRIIGIRIGLERDLVSLDLKRLLCLRREHQRALYLYASAQAVLRHLAEVGELVSLIDYLDRREERAVIYREESELVGASVSPHPAVDHYLFACVLFCVSE